MIKYFLGIFLLPMVTALQGAWAADEGCAGTQQTVIAEICEEIEGAEHPARIKKTEFTYRSDVSGTIITLDPASAFSIAPINVESGSAFRISITDPKRLFETRGGLLFPVVLTLKEISGVAGKIRIEPDARCETILEYKQAGIPLDLNAVGETFELEWEYPSALVTRPEIEGTQVRTQRIAKGPALVTLIVKDEGQEVARASRAVLDCASLPTATPSDDETINEPMTPSGCFRPGGLRHLAVENGSRVFYTAQNVCSVPIQCEWSTMAYHYNSGKDLEADIEDGVFKRDKGATGTGQFEVHIPARVGKTYGSSAGEFTQLVDNPDDDALWFWNDFSLAQCTWKAPPAG